METREMVEKPHLTAKDDVINRRELEVHHRGGEYPSYQFRLFHWIMNCKISQFFMEQLFSRQRRLAERHGHQLYELQRRDGDRPFLLPGELKIVFARALESIKQPYNRGAECKDRDRPEKKCRERPIDDVHSHLAALANAPDHGDRKEEL